MIERTPCVYILANRYNGAMYVGVTLNLIGRVLQHRDGRFDGYTTKRPPACKTGNQKPTDRYAQIEDLVIL